MTGAPEAWSDQALDELVLVSIQTFFTESGQLRSEWRQDPPAACVRGERPVRERELATCR